MEHARIKTTISVLCLILLIATITTFWVAGQHVLAIRGQTLNISIHIPTQLSKVLKGTKGILEMGTQDIVQVPVHIPINLVFSKSDAATANQVSGLVNTCTIGNHGQFYTCKPG
jgi:hypothetical protein